MASSNYIKNFNALIYEGTGNTETDIGKAVSTLNRRKEGANDSHTKLVSNLYPIQFR